MIDPRNNTYLRRLYTRLNVFSAKRLNRDWFRIQYSKGRCPHFLVQKINGISEIMESVFPGKWELQAWPNRNDKGQMLVYPLFVIKFDKIEITNNGDSMILEDLYVAIEFNNERSAPYISRISGTRGKVSPAEYDNGYMHSHLPVVGVTGTQSFNEFCLGDDGIAQTIMMLNSTWSYELFRMVMLQLDDYVRWESLDGGPHISMEDVYEKGDFYENKVLDSLMLKPIFKEVDDNVMQEDIMITRSGDRYTIHTNSTFINMLKDIVPSKYLMLEASNGNIYCADVGDKNRENIPTHIVWGGVPLKTIQITDRERNPIEGNISVDSNLVGYIKRYLEQKLTINLLMYEPDLH